MHKKKKYYKLTDKMNIVINQIYVNKYLNDYSLFLIAIRYEYSWRIDNIGTHINI